MKPQVAGNGDLIVFFNGGGCGQWMWQEVIARLSGYQTLTFDYDGYAGEPGTFISMDKEIEKATAYIKSYGQSKKVYLVGHSLGSQIILKLMQNVNTEVMGIDKAIAISALNIPQSKLLKQTLSLSKLVMPLTRKRWFAKLNAKSFNLPEHLFERYFEDSKNLDYQWLCNMMNENMSFHVPPQDPSKVSILAGDLEIKLMKDSVKSLSASPKLIKGAKHDIPYNFPDIVVQEIYEFFGKP